jgi:hypothetical protein
MLAWEIAGIFLIFFAGSLLHFTYQWTNASRFAAIFSAVNESTWEHLKLAFWPALFYAVLEYLFLFDAVDQFWFAKFLGIFLMPVLIVVIFYGYKTICGRHFLWADITTFFIAVSGGQIVSFLLMRSNMNSRLLELAGIAGLLVMTAAFSLLTLFPPRFFLFKDPLTGKYGIPSKR